MLSGFQNQEYTASCPPFMSPLSVAVFSRIKTMSVAHLPLLKQLSLVDIVILESYLHALLASPAELLAMLGLPLCTDHVVKPHKHRCAFWLEKL
jgi:hypothetical protein